MRIHAAMSLFILASASADTITLDDGKVLEGKVERKSGGDVRIRMEKAEITLPESRIRKVEPAPLPREAYLARLRELPNTPADHMALSRWCRGKGLLEEMREQANAAIALDPDYVEAREALGFRKVDGVWMSAEDQKRLAEREAVEVEGRFDGWTPDHKELYVAAKENGFLDPGVRRIARVGVPLVTLELRPTVSNLKAMREIVINGPGGARAVIEAPTVALSSVRTTAQVAAYP